MNVDLTKRISFALAITVACLSTSCSVMKGNILESDATVVGINLQAVEYGSITIGYKSGRVVSVPITPDCEEGGVPSIKSEKKIEGSFLNGATVTDTLNIGGLE